MPFLLIPNEVSSNSAVVWIAAINESFDPNRATFFYGGNQQALNAWNNWSTESGKFQVGYQRLQLSGLEPRQSYTLQLRIDDVVPDGATATIKTLPDGLPNAGDAPFTVLLGSCFYRREDKEGLVGKNFSLLPQKPDIKILGGDQVYLDNPLQDFVFPRSQQWLEDRSFKTYLDTWTQSFDGIKGFGELLKGGANFFSSDDHEYWNNAPDIGLNVLTFTATKGQRDNWFNMARNLYRLFQSTSTFANFSVDPLSFFVLDTRINRQPGRASLVAPADLTRCIDWIKNLQGPGVLVVGQPLLATKGSIKDWGLPDYPEYQLLVNALRSSEHSIVELTGDIHFPRLASVNLRADLGTRLFEVVSSPMQLVPLAKGKWEKAPSVWGDASTEENFWKDERNHFMTLEFWAASARRVHMTVKYWPIDPSGALPPNAILLTQQPIELA